MRLNVIIDQSKLIGIDTRNNCSFLWGLLNEIIDQWKLFRMDTRNNCSFLWDLIIIDKFRIWSSYVSKIISN